MGSLTLQEIRTYEKQTHKNEMGHPRHLAHVKVHEMVRRLVLLRPLRGPTSLQTNVYLVAKHTWT